MTDEYSRLREILLRAVQRLCPPWLSDHSEDLVQQVMIRLMERSHREGKPDFPASYLRRAAYNALIDEIRSRKRRAEVALESEPAPELDPAPGPERLLEATEKRRKILRCREALQPKRRTAVSLRLLGHSYSEVAELCGWTLKQAENLVLRGMRDLRACLKESRALH